MIFQYQILDKESVNNKNLTSGFDFAAIPIPLTIMEGALSPPMPSIATVMRSLKNGPH